MRSEIAERVREFHDEEKEAILHEYVVYINDKNVPGLAGKE